MRIVMPLLALAGTLVAHPVLAAEGDAARMAEVINDPERQAQMIAAAEAMTGAMLDMPAAPLLRAAATMAGKDPEDIDPDLSIGDLVGPEAAEAPREFAQRLPQMAAAMATMAAAFEGMLPQLREMGQRMAEDMARSTAE